MQRRGATRTDAARGRRTGEPEAVPADLAAGSGDRTDADGSGTADPTRTDGPNGGYVAGKLHAVWFNGGNQAQSNRKDSMSVGLRPHPTVGILVRQTAAPTRCRDKPPMTDNPPINPHTRNRRTTSKSTRSRTATSASKSTAKNSKFPSKKPCRVQPHSRLHPQDPRTGAQRQQVEYALAVQRALQAQPEETIRLLSRQYGLNLDPPPQSPPPQPTGGSSRPTTMATTTSWTRWSDGSTSTQRMIEQLTQAEQQRDADRRLNAAIGGLQRKYQADDSTIREVVGTALQARMGPESFEMIYKNIAYDREQQARAQAMATRQAQEAQREAAKTTRSAACRQRTIRQRCGRSAARCFRWTSCPSAKPTKLPSESTEWADLLPVKDGLNGCGKPRTPTGQLGRRSHDDHAQLPQDVDRQHLQR